MSSLVSKQEQSDLFVGNTDELMDENDMSPDKCSNPVRAAEIEPEVNTDISPLVTDICKLLKTANSYAELTSDSKRVVWEIMLAGREATNKINDSASDMSVKEYIELEVVRAEAALTRDALAESNILLVRWRAYKKFYTPDEDSMQDRIQAGMKGLLRAIDKHDPTLAEFSTYALYWIDASIFRYALQDKLLPASIRVGELRKKFFEEYERLESIHHREPTMQELERHTGLQIDVIQTLMLEGREVLSIDYYWNVIDPVYNSESAHAHIFDMSVSEPGYELADRKSAASSIVTLLATYVSDRTAHAMIMRYGFNGDKPMTEKKIGAVLGISISRVHQIIKAGIEALRDNKELVEALQDAL